MTRIRITAVAAAVALAVTLGTGSCSQKAQEQFNDAPRAAVQDDSAATVITMPDGFTNVATKCHDGDRLYVAFHGDGSYAGIAVAAADPNCASKG